MVTEGPSGDRNSLGSSTMTMGSVCDVPRRSLPGLEDVGLWSLNVLFWSVDDFGWTDVLNDLRLSIRKTERRRKVYSGCT